MSGGFCPGGFCPGGFCPRGDFVQGDFVRGDFVLGGILSRGILSGGFCPGGFVRGDFVPEPFHSHFASRQQIFRTDQDENISFALFAFEVQIFQLLRNFLTAKPIRLLC